MICFYVPSNESVDSYFGEVSERGKMEAFGDKVSLGMVRSFLEAFVERNPGSTMSWKADGEEFQRAFLCPALCKTAFKHST